MQENLAIASVPVQEWGALYGAEEALRVGTIFQDLNKPFFAADGQQAEKIGQGSGSGRQAGADGQGSGSGQQAGADGQGSGSGQQAGAVGQGAGSGQQAEKSGRSAGSGRQANAAVQSIGSGQGSMAGKAETHIGHCDRAASPEQQERERMMRNIQETGFVLDDLRLYLDTHPDDRQGLALLKDRLAERKTLLLTYAQKFYPLTADCMADFYENNPAPECYCWQKGPMPWEGACV